jgi:hypothetical protein
VDVLGKGVGAWIIAGLMVTTWAPGPKGSGTNVAGDFGSYFTTGRELHNIIRMGWLIKMTVEPPLIE